MRAMPSQIKNTYDAMNMMKNTDPSMQIVFFIILRVFNRFTRIEDFWVDLLENMGFDVYPMGYFFVCNANRDENGFYGKMNFEEAIIPYQLDYSGIESSILEMHSLMNAPFVPESNVACENCAYARQRNSFEV